MRSADLPAALAPSPGRQAGKGQSSSRHGPRDAPAQARASSLFPGSSPAALSPVAGSPPSGLQRCQSSPVTGTPLAKLNETKIDWLE